MTLSLGIAHCQDPAGCGGVEAAAVEDGDPDLLGEQVAREQGDCVACQVEQSEDLIPQDDGPEGGRGAT